MRAKNVYARQATSSSRADRRKKLTFSWDNSILPSYCALKANKYVSVCWPR
jgi:hypothetical protein